MSEPSHSSSESSGTLYDPPEGRSEEAVEEAESVSLRLSLPPDQADQLRAVARQLGLPPSLIAKRAVELVCGEVVTVRDSARCPHAPIDQYQARLDLLHAVDTLDGGQLESPTENE